MNYLNEVPIFGPQEVGVIQGALTFAAATSGEIHWHESEEDSQALKEAVDIFTPKPGQTSADISLTVRHMSVIVQCLGRMMVYILAGECTPTDIGGHDRSKDAIKLCESVIRRIGGVILDDVDGYLSAMRSIPAKMGMVTGGKAAQA